MTSPETRIEYAQPILDRHESAASEADIRSAVRDFLIQTGLAPESEIQQEEAPAPGESGRVDLRTRDVIIEFKRSIGNGIEPNAEYVDQLDGYLIAALDGGQPQRFGILTDGKHWILRWPRMGKASTSAPHAFTLANAELGTRLYDWLRRQSQALEERGVSPSEEQVRERLGGGPRFDQHIAALDDLYRANRDDPTIALKRDLWRSLLAAALGQVIEEEPDLDRLFVRHTYLSMVVGLALQSAFGIPIEEVALSDPAALVKGERFTFTTGVSGVVESDFFTWPVEVGGEPWLRDLARRISWFDWNQAESDIARILYEAVIPADDRRRLGEYYTPDWLAREIVDAMVTNPLNQRVLDPACGSGSFIFAAVRKYLTAARAAGRTPAQQVEGLLDKVVGIDVHPVAVHLARATWTLAAREALNEARGTGIDVTVPVYLGDSLQLRTESFGLFANSSVTLRIENDANGSSREDFALEFPRHLVETPSRFDRLMVRIADEIEEGGDPLWVLDEMDIAEPGDRQMLSRTIEILQQLHSRGRDHIWAYYARNLVRPIWLRGAGVDVVVGNPPWIAFRGTDAVLRTELERQSRGQYDIWAGRQYATTQDISGLFFARCADLYLKPNGVVGMVLPHSALRAGQYAKWRRGAWGDTSVDLSHRPAWDLEQIEPNSFFPVPASAVFARKTIGTPTPLSTSIERWRGPLGGPIRRELTSSSRATEGFASSYGEVARQGAIIIPRCLFFVNEEAATVSVQVDDVATTSPRRSAQEKSPWRELDLTTLANQPVEREHVWDVHLGETLAPYVLLGPLKAVLPISTATGQLAKLDDGLHGIRPTALGRRMRRRWREMNRLWEEHKNPNTKLDLLSQLDYGSKLSAQLTSASESPYRVVYSAAGRPTAAILVDSEIIDVRLVWVPAYSIEEAYYLTAIINSRVLEEQVEPLMSKGQYGARDLVKHLWRLPIPEYDDSDALHREIAEAGAAASERAAQVLADLRSERDRVTVTIARREIRSWLSESEEGQRVEGLVGRLLG